MTLDAPRWLLIPYAINILILVPVCYQMLFGGGVVAVFDGVVPESEGLRLLVGSLWSAILLASIGGLFWPSFFAPIVLAQVVYKALWLGLFVVPLWRNGQAYPYGISFVFALIVVTYPALFALAANQGAAPP